MMSASAESAPPPPFPDDISVAIVSYNGMKKLPKTLSALREAGCSDASITVVDVASTDGQLEWLRRQWPGVTVVEQTVNDGPGRGRNLMIEGCRTPWLLLMDSDGQVLADTVAVMRQTIGTDPRIAVVAPLVLYGDDPETIQYSNVGLHYLGEASIPWQGKPASERLGGPSYDVGVAPVCALLIRCSAFVDRDGRPGVGGFDERYFVCKEDGDWIHRVNIAGYRVVENPKAVVIHNCSPRTDSMFRRQLANGWHLVFKNYEKRTLVLIWPMIAMHAVMQLLLLVKKGHTETFWGGVKDFFAYLPTLGRDRATIRKIRRRHDTDILRCDDMLVRGDMAGGVVGKVVAGYNVAVRLYWRVVCTVLRPFNGPARPVDAELPPRPYTMDESAT